MKFNKTTIKFNFLYLSFFILFTSCNDNHIKFEKEKWIIKSDIFYKYREFMVKDLMDNHLKKGMPNDKVINLLGKPENYQNESLTIMSYEILVDYGWNIDPQKGTTLEIDLTSDMKVSSFKLNHWEH